MKSPCLICAHRNESKTDNPRCDSCRPRWDYVAALEGLPAITMRTSKERSMQATEIPGPAPAPAVQKKKCTRCGQELPADTEHFYRNKAMKDGLEYWCKPCKLASKRENYKHNKSKKKPQVKTRQPEVKPITLDFAGHDDIYKKLIAAAKEDLRPVAYQAMYLIRQALS